MPHEVNGLPVFSTSEEVAYKTCKLAHHFEYVLGYRPTVTNRKLSIGIGVHEGLEVGYKGGTTSDIEERLTEWADERWTELLRHHGSVPADVKLRFMMDRDLVTDMVKRYFDWVTEEGLDTDYEVVDVESHHYIEVPGAPCILPIKIDLLQRHKQSGRLRVVDFKTRDKFYRDTTGYQLAEQNGNYQIGVVALYGELPTELQYRELRKMSPTLNPGSKPPYFRAVTVRLTPEELKRRVADYAATAIERFDPERTYPVANPAACCGSWKNDWQRPCLKVHQGYDPQTALEESDGYAPADVYARYPELQGGDE